MEDLREVQSDEWGRYLGSDEEEFRLSGNYTHKNNEIRRLLEEYGSENVRIFTAGVWVRRDNVQQKALNVIED